MRMTQERQWLPNGTVFPKEQVKSDTGRIDRSILLHHKEKCGRGQHGFKMACFQKVHAPENDDGQEFIFVEIVKTSAHKRRVKQYIRPKHRVCRRVKQNVLAKRHKGTIPLMTTRDWSTSRVSGRGTNL